MSKINIAVGIEEKTTEEDIEKLVNAGADEFFCGIVPPKWAEVYGYALSINKRYDKGAQFSSYYKLGRIIDRIHSCGKQVFVTFNAHYYDISQLSYLKSCLIETEKLKPDAVIVTDVGLLLLIKDCGLKFNVHISGEAGVYSSESVRFFHKFGITRIKFPRDITIANMKEVIDNTKLLGLQYEAFIMDQRCPFSGVGCRSSHGLGPRDFCYQLWQKDLHVRLPFNFRDIISKTSDIEAIIPKPSIRLLKLWGHNTKLYKMWTIGGLFAAFTHRDESLRECGLCAVQRLIDIGVSSLKMVTRGKHVDKKIMQIKILRQVIATRKITSGNCKQLKNTPEICDTGYICYYPEARNHNHYI